MKNCATQSIDIAWNDPSQMNTENAFYKNEKRCDKVHLLILYVMISIR